jgi:hypothetical protein
MMSRLTFGAMLLVLGVAACLPALEARQPAVDTSRVGPAVGSTVPPFSGSDQFGRPQTLESAMGSKGLMLVFFRSADW